MISTLIERAWSLYAPLYDVVQPFAIRLFHLFGDLSYDEFQEKFVELAKVKPGQTVLDVACGTGASHEALSAALGPEGKLAATDISKEMLDRARSRARRLKLPKIKYQKADAEDLADYFEEEAFDAVLSCNGLPNFPHPRRALAEMTRVLRRGGTLAVSTVNRDRCDKKPLLRMAFKFLPLLFYMEEYRSMLIELGLTRIKFHEQGLMLIITAVKRKAGKPSTKRKPETSLRGQRASKKR